MAGALVLFVLLDGLAELPNNFNQTLRNELSKLSSFNISNTQVCEPKLAKYVLDKVKYFNADNPDPNRNYFDFDTVETQDKLISDDITKEHTIFENSMADLIDDNSIENDELMTINDAEYDDESMSKFNEQFGLNTAASVTESLLSLVAIFETLSNVTAQTCAGTLLSPHWVITAASCVNILAGICSNETNCTKTSRYTVVAGSTNPFVDGSIHNVTAILLHPEQLTNNQKLEANPVLAMMKIDPEYKAEKMGIWSGEAEENMNARVYGWTLLKNESGQDVMKMSSVAVSYTQCQLTQVTSASGLCFDMEISGNNTQLGTGGPVLLEKGRSRMLAVVLDDRAPLLAEPLAAHAAWVQRVINNHV